MLTVLRGHWDTGYLAARYHRSDLAPAPTRLGSLDNRAHRAESDRPTETRGGLGANKGKGIRGMMQGSILQGTTLTEDKKNTEGIMDTPEGEDDE